MEEIALSSRLDEVVVHARGALVTRVVELPEGLPGGVVDLIVDHLPLGAAAGTFRAVLEGSQREVVSLKSRVVLPDEPVLAGATVARLRDLHASVARVKDALDRCEGRRARYAVVGVRPDIANAAKSEERDPSFAERFSRALSTIEVMRDVAAELDAQSIAYREELSDLERAIAVAELDDAAASSAARRGTGNPRRACTVRLQGEGPPGRLLVKYAVRLARWWPRYALRVATQVRAAEWRLEALVCQRSGEDWRDVRLVLSTADLVTDARMPQLRSLRFGRAQRKAPTGYREAPEGTDALFASYDRAKAALAPPNASTMRSMMRQPSAVSPVEVADDTSWDDDHVMTNVGYGGSLLSDDSVTPPFGTREDTAVSAMRAPPAPRAAPAPGMMLMRSVAPQAAAMPMAAMASAAPPNVARSARPSGLPRPPRESVTFEPGDEWLDYDALVLEPFESSRQRGKLVRARAREVGSPGRELTALEAMDAPGVIDPLVSRGAFDHRYEGTARVDVPSDGGMHRLALLSKKGPIELSFRAAPRASEHVYREARAKNPFDAPLLAGPLEVHIDGGFVAETTMRKTDRGGDLTVGLGVEERVRIVRNVRVHEESAGLLGGSLAVRHDVSVEVASTLGFPIVVHLIDVLPVTDDKDVSVERTRSSHPEERYDQKELGRFVRGGTRFVVDVAAGGRTKVEYGYVLKFSGKLEIVGGNRRE